jgi:hypothetical protein
MDMDPLTVASTSKEIVDLIRAIVGLAKKAGNQELNAKVADLQVRILAIQTQLIELTNENQDLRKRASDLEQAVEIGKGLKYEESVYWLPKDAGREGPFCPNCWDSQHKLIRLTQGATKGTCFCGVCKAGGFRTSEFKQAAQGAMVAVPSRFRNEQF